nr:MAG TPA: hypothetical protein [Caudoviricetes sp.]
MIRPSGRFFCAPIFDSNQTTTIFPTLLVFSWCCILVSFVV